MKSLLKIENHFHPFLEIFGKEFAFFSCKFKNVEMSLYKKCCSITKSKCYSKNSDTNFIGRELQLSDYEIHPKSMTTQRFFSQSLLITLLSIKTENAQQLIFLLLYQTHFPPFPVKFKTLPLSQLRHRE